MTRDVHRGRAPTGRPALRLPDGDVRRWLYGLAPVALTVIIRWLLEPMLEEKSPFLLFTLAVLLAAIFGGVWVGATGGLLGGMAGAEQLAQANRAKDPERPRLGRSRSSRPSSRRLPDWDGSRRRCHHAQRRSRVA
jgi:hypothetical protein